jgi:hypothetical protein
MHYVVPAAHGHVMVETTSMRACDGAHCMGIPYIPAVGIVHQTPRVGDRASALQYTRLDSTLSCTCTRPVARGFIQRAA